jgi:hypothetical protein
LIKAKLLDLVLGKQPIDPAPPGVRPRGLSSPAIARNSVDLPAPLGPRSPIRAPARIAQSTSVSIALAP